MLDQKRAIYRANSGPDEYREAHHNRAIDLTIQKDSGSLNIDLSKALEDGVRRNMGLMKNANCNEVRQEGRNEDRTGLASANGFVAITSLDGILADSVLGGRVCRQ